MSWKKRALLIALSVLLLMVSGILNQKFHMGSKFLAPEFPLVILAATIIFRVFISFEVKRNYYVMARYTYVAYLYHIFGIMLGEKIVNTICPNMAQGWQSILVFAIAVVVSFAIGCAEYHFRVNIQNYCKIKRIMHK